MVVKRAFDVAFSIILFAVCLPVLSLIWLLVKVGYLIEEPGMTTLADTDPDSALGPRQAAGCSYGIAFGPRAGQKVLSLQTVPVNAQGFSLHAEFCCAAHQRKKLEHLCRYITRAAIANERLTLNRAGQVVLTLKTPIEMARPTSSCHR